MRTQGMPVKVEAEFYMLLLFGHPVVALGVCVSLTQILRHLFISQSKHRRGDF